MKELTDEQIVKSVINGNEDIYREIIKRYEKKLSRYLCKFINNPEDIEDVLQIIFIKTYKNLYGFNLDKKFSSWIYRISHNEAINYLKKYKNNRICLDDIEYKLIDEKIDIKKETDRIFLKKDIEDALNNIDIKYREPIVLFYLEEMSYDEISDILRIPKNTVGTLILRGKKILKEELSEIKKKL